jgi:hypothetical protein
VNHKLIILGALPEEEELLTSPSPLSDFIWDDSSAKLTN